MGATQEKDKERECCYGYHDAGDLFGAFDDFVVHVYYIGHCQRDTTEIE